MRSVLTIGTFDVPHVGHAYLLRQCERLGDELTVGINTDNFVKRFKAPPLYTWHERSFMIGQLGFRTVPNDGPGHDLIEQLRPSVLAIGMDWLPPKDYLAQIATTSEELSEWGVVLAFLPTMQLGGGEKVSSSEIKQRVSDH